MELVLLLFFGWIALKIFSKFRKSKKKYAKMSDVFFGRSLPPWLYNGKKFRGYMRGGAIGFVYEVVFVDGKKYIGRKFFDRHGSWKSYIGSGRLVSERIDLYGKENIVQSRAILSMHDSVEELCSMEERIQRDRDVVRDQNYLNLRYGDSGSGRRHNRTRRSRNVPMFKISRGGKVRFNSRWLWKKLFE